MEKAEGVEVEMRSQQTTNKQNTFFFFKIARWGSGPDELKGASVCLAHTLVRAAFLTPTVTFKDSG